MGLFDKFKKQKPQEQVIVDETGEVIDVSVTVEAVPFDEQPDESALVEIKDQKMIAYINQAIPDLLNAGAEIGKSIFGKKNQMPTETLYRAILPPGAVLTQSREIPGAVRGFAHGANGIKTQANFVAVDVAAKNTKSVSSTISNAASSVMGIASMVVGQYYMEQINSELSKISDTIEQVSNFQNNEYKSDVATLFDFVQREATFQGNTLENEETRRSKANLLIPWEQKCVKLLRQANSTLSDLIKKKDYEFDKYEKELTEIHTWYIYQQGLLNLLYQIVDLKHTLFLGAISKEECYSLLPKYEKETENTNKQLQEWHESYAKKFELNAEAKTRKHDGLVGMLMFLPGLINQSLQICSVSDKTLELIAEQSSVHEIPSRQKETDLFQEDVTLIAKDGKLYYLPETKV